MSSKSGIPVSNSFLAASASLLIATFAAVPAGAQQSATGWHSYFGCWQPVAAQASASPAGAPGRAVCIIPVEGAAAIQFVTVMNDSVIDRLRINTSGDRIPANREGCTGWESTTRGLASRVYARSEYVCEGGITRRSSGLISMLSPDEWLDVQTVEVGGHSSIVLQRYRQAEVPAVVAAEVGGALRDRGMAISSARIAGGAVLSLDDIVDASRNATPSTVEVWLLEKRQGFVLKRKHVEYLAGKQVPEHVIDMVVALSYSEFFRAELSQRRLALYPSMETPVNPNRVASPDYVRPAGANIPTQMDYSNTQRHSRSERGDYFYDQNYYSPFGFFFYDIPTYRNRYYRPVQPVVVIIKPGGSGRSGGDPNPPVAEPPAQQPPPVRLFNGQGYTNGVQTNGTTNQNSNVSGTGTAGTNTNGAVIGRGGSGAPGANSAGASSGSVPTGSNNAATGGNRAATAAPPAAEPPRRTAQPRQGTTTNSGRSGGTTGGASSTSGSSSSSRGSSSSGSSSSGSSSSGSTSGGSSTGSGAGTATGRGRGG